MRPYWVNFADLPSYHELGRGAGVTAIDEQDAATLIAENFGHLTITTLRPIIDINELDQGKVRPNMGSIFLRGVWFPLGHEPVGHSQTR
jgi:hypothetical protein